MSKIENYYTTIGLHCGLFEMEVLVNSTAESEAEAKEIGQQGKYHIAHLSESELVFRRKKSRVKVLSIQKDEIEKYQFRICKKDKVKVSAEDYEDLTWDEAIKYLVEEENRVLPISLESYYYVPYDNPPFKNQET